MKITVLCKVVDNFGDVGVTWRLVNQLKNKYPSVEINYLIDDLKSFNKICDLIDINESYQKINDINIFDSKDYELCYETFRENDGDKLSLILECFQCGRPEWMEKILFEDKLERTVNIIMIDYLTAEKYADDFHGMESLTRSKKVKKINFMPGFTDKTGGLIIDKNWETVEKRNKNGSVLIFTYERNWQPLVNAINKMKNKVPVKIGQGRGFESFMNSVKQNDNNTSLFIPLDYVNQDEWDKIMKDSSALFIRGEESMSRACLSGIPFVWHAYPQSDEYQLVKVNALLDRMKEYFTDDQFMIIKNVWLDFNSPENEIAPENFENHCLEFLDNVDNLEDGFYNFALSLQKNGDLCSNLMTFIKKVIIMN